MPHVEELVRVAGSTWTLHVEGLCRLVALYETQQHEQERAQRLADARAKEAAAQCAQNQRLAEQQRIEAEARAEQEREQHEHDAAERAAAEARAHAERAAALSAELAEQAAAEERAAEAALLAHRCVSPATDVSPAAVQAEPARQALTPRMPASPNLHEAAVAVAAPERSPLPLCLPFETPCRMEGAVEDRPSAWRPRTEAAPAESPEWFRVEGAPEVCRSALRPAPPPMLTLPLADEASAPSPAAPPPSAAPTALPTALAVRQAQAALSPLEWPTARPSSLAGHPALTPTLDTLALPAHPILLRSPESPAPSEHVRSPSHQSPTCGSAEPAKQVDERVASGSPGGGAHSAAVEAPAGSISLDAAAESPAATADSAAPQREEHAGPEATPPRAVDVALSCSSFLRLSAGEPRAYSPLRLLKPRPQAPAAAPQPVAAPVEQREPGRVAKRARSEAEDAIEAAAPAPRRTAACGDTQTPPAAEGAAAGTPGRVSFSARVTHLDSDGEDAALRDHGERCAAPSQP